MFPSVLCSLVEPNPVLEEGCPGTVKGVEAGIAGREEASATRGAEGRVGLDAEGGL